MILSDVEVRKLNAKKCDRCTKFYSPYKPTDATKFSNLLILAESREDGSYLEWRQFDLCEDCMKDLCAFMREKLG